MQLSFLFASVLGLLSLIPGLSAVADAEFSRGTSRYRYGGRDYYDNDYGYGRRSGRRGRDYGSYRRYRRDENSAQEVQEAQKVDAAEVAETASEAQGGGRRHNRNYRRQEYYDNDYDYDYGYGRHGRRNSYYRRGY